MNVNSHNIFIAAPYTIDPETCVNSVRAHMFKLMRERPETIVHAPVLFAHEAYEVGRFTDWDAGQWELWTGRYLLGCQELHVLRIPGWDQSSGVLNEIKLARVCSIPISYY